MNVRVSLFRLSPMVSSAKPSPELYGGAASTGWGLDYYLAMLKRGVPNIEAHLYGRGRHCGGLADRDGIPFGTWQDRFIDWFRDLGYLGKPGVPTKAASDIKSYVAKQSLRDSRK